MARIDRSTVLVALLCCLAATLVARARPASAQLSEMRIQEVLTSWQGDAAFQLVEIRVLGPTNNDPKDAVLAAFDANGTYVTDLATVTQPLVVFRDDRILFGTNAVAQVHGNVDVAIGPSVPTNGMVCFGAPVQMNGEAPDPSSWDHSDPENYIDCVAYGFFQGTPPSQVGSPVPLDAVGHSLHRVFDTADNAADFRCGTPSPQDLFIRRASYLMANAPCPDPRFYTLAGPLAFDAPASSNPVHDLVGTVHPVRDRSGFEALPLCASRSSPCFQPLGDTVFFQLEVGPGSDEIEGIGGIVTNDSPIPLSAPQAGWLREQLEDGQFPTLKVPRGPIDFTHGYNGSTIGVEFDTPLREGDRTTVLFVHYPTGSVERAVAARGGFAVEVFAPGVSGSFETGIAPLPEPGALPAAIAAIAAMGRLSRRPGPGARAGVPGSPSPRRCPPRAPSSRSACGSRDRRRPR